MVLHYLVPDSSVKNDVIVEGVLYVLGQGFIRLMKMLVVPLVFCSHGMWKYGYHLILRSWGNVGGKTLAFLSGYNSVGSCSCPWNRNSFLRPGIGLDMSKIRVRTSDIETMESTSLVQTILNIIPDNPIKSWQAGKCFRS